MSEEKKYREGTVKITSEEYHDLVKDAVIQKKDAEEYRSKMWERERERDKFKEEKEALEGALQAAREKAVYIELEKGNQIAELEKEVEQYKERLRMEEKLLDEMQVSVEACRMYDAFMSDNYDIHGQFSEFAHSHELVGGRVVEKGESGETD